MQVRVRLLVLPVIVAFIAGCPSTPPAPGAADASPPSFANAVVRLEPNNSTTFRREFDINGPDDVIQANIGSDLALRLNVLAGDPQSGISGLTVESELRWRCQLGNGSPVIGIFERAPIQFDTFTPPAAPITPFAINLRADPIAQTGCARSPGRGPVSVSGFVRVIAVNGANPGSTAATMTFVFDYEDAVGASDGTHLSTGTSSDSPYMAECRRQGVPIPPDWSPRSTAWIRHGNIGDSNSNLLQPGADAFVWSYTHPRVRGACIALPRGMGGQRGGLAGIICQSATTGRACFWDSRRRNDANPLAEMPVLDWSNEVLRLAELKDATNLVEMGSAPPCTQCHHGENAFLMSPDDPAWGQVLRADLGPTFTTQVDASPDMQGGHPRFIPVSGINGAVRPGWVNTFTAGGCGAQCHEPPTLARAPLMPPACAGTNPIDVSRCYR